MVRQKLHEVLSDSSDSSRLSRLVNVDEGLHRLREEHGEILREHGGRLGAVEQQVRANGMTLKQVLGAVEYGNKQRDSRLIRIEDHLDLPPLES